VPFLATLSKITEVAENGRRVRATLYFFAFLTTLSKIPIMGIPI
jgi:hypothetical protein